MSNYAGLRPYQNTPLAALVQLALNATGASLTVDGAYGRNSVRALKDFQRDRKMVVDGVVGKNTWKRLMERHKFEIGDIANGLEKYGLAYEVTDLRAVGAKLSVGYPMSTDNSVAMFKDIFNRLDASNLSILRFHGHGYAGGHLLVGATARHHGEHLYNVLDAELLADPDVQAAFRILRKKMGKYGFVQLNGCNVGRGRDGRDLLRDLARILGVPVCAGKKTQLAGGRAHTFFMEGEIETRCPGDLSLKAWAQNLQPLLGLSPV